MSGGSGVGERWNGIFGVVAGDGREWARSSTNPRRWIRVERPEDREFIRAFHGCAHYADAEILPPPGPKPGDLVAYYSGGRWHSAPPPPVGAQPDAGQPLPGLFPAQDRGDADVPRVKPIWDRFELVISSDPADGGVDRAEIEPLVVDAVQQRVGRAGRHIQFYRVTRSQLDRSEVLRG